MLAEKSRKQKYTATLLPIRTVGVQVSWQTGFLENFLWQHLLIVKINLQGDQRTYSYAVGISSVRTFFNYGSTLKIFQHILMQQSQVSDPDWEDLAYFARLIPRVCHNINRLSQDGKI